MDQARIDPTPEEGRSLDTPLCVVCGAPADYTECPMMHFGDGCTGEQEFEEGFGACTFEAMCESCYHGEVN